jgi:uncharacterized membrane protein YjgN (DUF898 family)
VDQTSTTPEADLPTHPQDEETGHVVVEAPAADLARLAMHGLLFTALTFGLYRFWYVTRLRRYLWAHTRLGRSPFEFTGRPIDLIVGFLMAVAILLPLYLALFIMSLGLSNGVIAANLGALGLLWFLSQFGIYRARNYRLTRTVWRGLRFRQGGSGILYAILSIIWFVIGLASLGLLWPMRRRALYAYKVRNTFYGKQKAGFKASIWPLYHAGWPLFVGFCAVGLLGGWRLMAIWWQLPESLATANLIGLPPHDILLVELASALPLGPLFWLVCWVSAAMLALLALFGPSYLSAETRHFTNATTFGPVRLASNLSSRSLATVWSRYLLILVAFSAVYLAFGAALSGAFLSSDMPVGVLDDGGTRIWFFAILFVFYCIGFMGYAVIHLLYLRFRLWQTIGNSVSLHPMQLVPDMQSGSGRALRHRDGFGEGIADALDAGGL